MNGRLSAVVVILIGLGVSSCGSSSDPVRSGTLASRCAAPAGALRQLVAVVHEKQSNVGVAAAIRMDDELIFSEFLGKADLEHDVRVTSATRFGAASLTKLFTAVTLLKLHEQDRIDLDAPVQRYVPSFPEKEDGTITIRMLATHRSGIPHPQDRTPELFATHYETARDSLEVFADEPLVATPGDRRVYSSSNYNLMAAAMEAAAGKPFPEIVREMIFLPLGLDSTVFDDVRRPVPNRSERYSFYHPWTYEESDELYEVPRWDYSFNMGGGNITSTTSDLTRFGLALSQPGLLSSEALELLYDEAWFGKRTGGGTRYIYATGSNPGVQAGIAVFPDARISAAVLSNTWGLGSRSGEMAALAKVLAESCL